MTTFSREDFYALVWANPMTKLAKQFGLSDVALHKVCRKHSIPTPPQGYWAKKAHGKAVTVTPLPRGENATIIIHKGAGANESAAVAAARIRVHAALSRGTAEGEQDWSDPILDRSLAQLAERGPGTGGLVHVEGHDLVTIAVRPDTVSRVHELLSQLVQTAYQAGLRLIASDAGAAWDVDGVPVTFAVREIADRLEHVPTELELRAVAKWEAECAAYFKRTGYTREWGRPSIPQWEERFQGRLSVILEKVRDRTSDTYWGPALRSKFSDSKTREVARAMPQVVAAIVTIGVTKRENASADEARRIARDEEERRRREAERRAALERARQGGLAQMLTSHAARFELADWLADLERRLEGRKVPARMLRLRDWARQRWADLDASAEPEALEQWLAAERLFAPDED